MSLNAVLATMVLAVLVGCAPKQIARSYTSPEETFETWRQAAQRLDYDVLLSCYTTQSQPQMRNQFSATTNNEMEAMQSEAKKTKFAVEKIVFDGSKAYLRVLRKLGSDEDVEVLTMIKEGMEWKLIP